MPNIAIESGPVEIVDLPSYKTGDLSDNEWYHISWYHRK
jgi:hypothetical protein